MGVVTDIARLADNERAVDAEADAVYAVEQMQQWREACQSAEADRDRLQARVTELADVLEEVVQHVEARFPAGTHVDPVFRRARAALAAVRSREQQEPQA